MAAKLFRLPTIPSTVAAQGFSGAMIPEVTGIFPDRKPIDRTSINSCLASLLWVVPIVTLLKHQPFYVIV